MTESINDIIGLVFVHPETAIEYGVIRDTNQEAAVFGEAKVKPIAEDGCGNIFGILPDGSVSYWDHETDELLPLASDMKAFRTGCRQPEEVTLDPNQVESAWIDPEFAKLHNIDAPEDGWIKKSS